MQISGTTNIFIAVIILLKKSNVFGTCSLWPSSGRKITAVYLDIIWTFIWHWH